VVTASSRFERRAGTGPSNIQYVRSISLGLCIETEYIDSGLAHDNRLSIEDIKSETSSISHSVQATSDMVSTINDHVNDNSTRLTTVADEVSRLPTRLETMSIQNLQLQDTIVTQSQSTQDVVRFQTSSLEAVILQGFQRATALPPLTKRLIALEEGLQNPSTRSVTSKEAMMMLQSLSPALQRDVVDAARTLESVLEPGRMNRRKPNNWSSQYDERKGQTAVLAYFRLCIPWVQRGVTLSLHSTSGAGMFSISHTLKVKRFVRDSSPAFEAIALYEGGISRDWAIPTRVAGHIDELIIALRSAWQSGKASPWDVDREERSVLHLLLGVVGGESRTS
jgi:hypothetical protein